MKADSKTILIGAIVIAALLVLGAYRFFYSSDMEEIDKVQGEINTYNGRLNELNEKSSKRAMYEAGIVDSEDVIKTVLSLYGPGNTPEKTIMLVVDMCNKIGVNIPSISFVNDSRVYSSEEQNENGEPKIQIYKSGMAIQISGGYTQMKKLMDYINSYPERMNVETFSETFDGKTGFLQVAMNVNMYSVKDDNHVYEAPVIDDIEIGTTNVFRTMETLAEEEGTEDTENVTSEAQTENNTAE